MKRIIIIIGIVVIFGILTSQAQDPVRPVALPIVPENMLQFFPEPGRTAELRFRLETPPAEKRIEYRISDYSGRKFGGGAAICDGKGAFSVNLDLPGGYYEIEFPAVGRSYGICCLPRYRGTPDPFFGIGAQFCWFGRSSSVRQERMKVLRQAGVSIAREQLTWATINREPGRYDFNSGPGFDNIRSEYRANGLKTLDMFADSPAWTNQMRWETNIPPYDLSATFESWSRIAEHWKESLHAMEILNEINDPWGCGNTTVDQCASVHKTVRYAVNQNGRKVLAANAPFTSAVTEEYFRLLVGNGFFDACDFFSFHYYRGPLELGSELKKYRLWLNKYRLEWMPFIITECGAAYPLRREVARPAPREAKQSALDIAMNGEEAFACGVEGYFPFVFAYYPENNNNFSMLDPQNSPLRSTGAYFQLANVLSHAVYAGDFKIENPDILRSRCFRLGDGRAVVIVYSASPEKPVKVRGGDHRLLYAQGIDGRELAPDADQSVTMEDGMCYLYYDMAEISRELKPDPEVEFLRPKGPRPATATFLSPIVLQYRINPKVSPSTSKGYLITRETLNRLPLSIRIHNFSEQRQTVVLKLEADGVDNPVILPPVTIDGRSFADVDREIALPAPGPDDLPVVVTVTAQSPEGAFPATPLAVQFTPEPRLPARREKLDPARLRLSPEIQKEGKMSVALKHNTIVAEMDLTETPKSPWPGWATVLVGVNPESLSGVKGLAIRMKCDGTGWGRIKFRVRNHDSFMSEDGNICVDGKWHLYYLPLEPERMRYWRSYHGKADKSFDKEKITDLYFVIHSFSRKHRLEISDIYLYR